MNTTIFARRPVTMRIYAVLAAVSLLLSAMPMSVFTAEATVAVGNPGQCPVGYTKIVDDYTGGMSWTADADYDSVILRGGPPGGPNNDPDGRDKYFPNVNQGDTIARVQHDISHICAIPAEPTVDFCDPSQRPDGKSIAQWHADAGFDPSNCFDYKVINQCGSLDVELTNKTGLGFAFNYSIGTGIPQNPDGDGLLPVSFVEDEYGGSVDVTFYITGPESDWFIDSDIPNYWDGKGETVSVDTDCKEPAPSTDLRVCKLIVDEQGTVIDGSGLDTDFSVRVTGPGGYDQTVTFDTGLGLNTDLVDDNGTAHDAECVVLSNLKPGEYLYAAEQISGEGAWGAPLYHDFFTGVPNSIDDFFMLTVDGSPEDNDDADGVINLNQNKQRTLAMVNTLLREPEVPQLCSFAGVVVDYSDPAFQNNNVPVNPARRAVSAVENGPATYNNFFGKEGSAWQVSPLDFFSLGIEGWLVYEFTDYVVTNQPGPDIALWEITGGPASQKSDEKTEVLVSQNGVDFVSLGTVTGDGAVDIAPAGLDFVKFIKLVDDSVGVQGTSGDGYDVDGITIIDGSCMDYTTIKATKIICEDESLLPNDGYKMIDAGTAQAFLDGLGAEERSQCRLATEDEFAFQWALGGVNTPDAPDNDGELGNPWQTPVPTSMDGVATMIVTAEMLGKNSQVSVREVMDTDNYIPFTGVGGSDKSAELYCHNDAANYDNLEWVKDVMIDSTYHCVAWNVPLEKESDVTLCKYDEEQNPLAGWQLALLGEKVGGVEVKPDGNEYTIAGAPAGDYVLKASGAYVYRPTNLLADASFSERLPVDTGYGTYPYQPWRITQLPNQHLGVKVNGDAMVWGTVFSPTHVYYTNWNPTDVSNTGTFQITDTQYKDNKGTILVEAFYGYTGVTGDNGCVTFTDVPYGDYEVEELLQLDWENVSGLVPVVVDDESERFAVVNRDLTETPVATLIAEKVVCVAEEYLPNWNDNNGKAPNITSTTAAQYVADSDGKCWLEDDWYFEWASQSVANPDNDLPDNPFYGMGGTDWNTFGPTDGSGKASVNLTAADIDGDSAIWVREVLQEGYIPFTYGPGNQTNADNETAAFYCHTDGRNYDNYDKVEGIAVENTYHCVAFNTEIEKPVEQCVLDIYSDTMTLVADTNMLAVATYDGNTAWTASIPGATWVWATDKVEDPATTTTYTFVETFTVDNPTKAEITVAHDNWVKLYVNGDLIVDRTGINGFRDYQVPPPYDILGSLNLIGENMVEFEVTNQALNNSSYLSNPAGVLFYITAEGDPESCARTTEPEDDNGGNGDNGDNGSNDDDNNTIVRLSGGGGGGGVKYPECRDITLTNGMLEWKTLYGDDLSLAANGVEIFTTADEDTVDEGSRYVGTAANVTYLLTVENRRGSDTCSVTSEFLGGVGGDFPQPLVLGEQVSAVPLGAPDTGAGGTSTAPNTGLTFMQLLFNTRRIDLK